MVLRKEMSKMIKKNNTSDIGVSNNLVYRGYKFKR